MTATEMRCRFCDAAADYYAAKSLALAAADAAAAAEADALGALAEDAAVVAHGHEPQVPQFGTVDDV